MYASLVFRLVIELCIEMHEATLDLLETLNGNLQCLTYIMCIAKGHQWIKYNVQFNEDSDPKICERTGINDEKGRRNGNFF